MAIAVDRILAIDDVLRGILDTVELQDLDRIIGIRRIDIADGARRAGDSGADCTIGILDDCVIREGCALEDDIADRRTGTRGLCTVDQRDRLVVAADFLPVRDLARQDVDGLLLRDVVDLVVLVDDEDERLNDDLVVDEALVLVLIRQVDIRVADLDRSLCDLVHTRERTAACDVDRHLIVLVLESFLCRLQERQECRRARSRDLAGDFLCCAARRAGSLLAATAAARQQHCRTRDNSTDGKKFLHLVEHIISSPNHLLIGTLEPFGSLHRSPIS